MNRLTTLQIERNKATQSNWSRAERHRWRVTSQILAGAPVKDGRLCVLGAGNCNELDLRLFINRFAELHLVDIDGDALASAVDRQGLSDCRSIHLHGGIDVTGIWGRLAECSPDRPADDANLAGILEEAKSFTLPNLPGPFSAVASVCVLSQLIEGAAQAVGEQHSRFLELVQAIRRTHFELLVNLTAVGGHGLLVSDFVSSATAPELLTVVDDDMPDLTAQLINARNFFTGLNPVIAMDELQNDPAFASRVAKCQLSRPWRWDAGPRVYAVAAVRFRRA